MACIGLIGKETRQLEVVAHAGMNAEDLKALYASLNTKVAYQQQAGHNTFLNGNGVLHIDIGHVKDPTVRTKHTPRVDYHPSIVLPFLVRGQTRAVLFLYRPATRLFDVPELKLLNQIATSISFAMEFAEQESERRLAHDARRRNERRFHKLIEHSGGVISLLNAQGIVESTSELVARILGYSIEEYVGLGSEVLVHPDDLPKVREVIDKISAQPDLSHTFEIRARHRNGHSIWMEVTLTNRLHDPDVGAIVSNSRDITRRKKAEEALRVFHTLNVEEVHHEQS